MFQVNYSAAASVVRRIEAEVEAEYAPRLARAGRLRQWWLRLWMRRELAERLERLASRVPYLIRK